MGDWATRRQFGARPPISYSWLAKGTSGTVVSPFDGRGTGLPPLSVSVYPSVSMFTPIVSTRKMRSNEVGAVLLSDPHPATPVAKRSRAVPAMRRFVWRAPPVGRRRVCHRWRRWSLRPAPAFVIIGLLGPGFFPEQVVGRRAGRPGNSLTVAVRTPNRSNGDARRRRGTLRMTRHVHIPGSACGPGSARPLLWRGSPGSTDSPRSEETGCDEFDPFSPSVPYSPHCPPAGAPGTGPVPAPAEPTARQCWCRHSRWIPPGP